MDKIATTRFVVCGAGALGSNLVDNLTRLGAKYVRVIDDDRVEDHNIGTQLYGLADVGALKVDVLRSHLYRACEIELDAINKRLKNGNVKKFLKGAELVIDTFDNAESRELVRKFCLEADIACLHVGLFEDYGEVLWNKEYVVPTDGNADVCDYPLARNLVVLLIGIASEVAIRFVLNGSQTNWTATLGDFQVLPSETTCPHIT